jgi:hypothetical protein
MTSLLLSRTLSSAVVLPKKKRVPRRFPSTKSISLDIGASECCMCSRNPWVSTKRPELECPCGCAVLTAICSTCFGLYGKRKEYAAWMEKRVMRTCRRRRDREAARMADVNRQAEKESEVYCPSTEKENKKKRVRFAEQLEEKRVYDRDDEEKEEEETSAKRLRITIEDTNETI